MIEEPNNLDVPEEDGLVSQVVDDAGQTAIAKPPSPDLINAADFVRDRAGDYLAYDPAVMGWRWFTGTHWERERPDSPRLREIGARALRHTAQRVRSTRSAADVLHFAEYWCTRAFEQPQGIVNFRNGSLTIATMELRPHNPADNLTWCLPFDYAPGDYPETRAFLEMTIPDPEGRRVYMTHVGLGTLGDRTQHKALLLIGGGRSGKGTLMKIANAVCGLELRSFAGATLFDRGTEGMWARYKWNGRPLVCIDELPHEALRAEDIFKSMVAHEGVPQRAMRQTEVLANAWSPKLIMASNERPRYSDPSGALTKRLIVIACPNSRTDDPDETDPAKRVDPHLLDRLLPEVPAFAAACIEAGLQAQRDGAYPTSPAMRALLREIAERGDPLKSWAADHCVLGAAFWTPTADLFKAYSAYCVESGYRPLASERFTQSLREIHPELQPARGHMDGRQVRGIQGIRLRTPADPFTGDEGGERLRFGGARP